MQQLRATTKSLTFPPLSIARYSFIQLSRQGRQWREGKCPIFQTVAKGIRTRAHLIASPAFYHWATAQVNEQPTYQNNSWVLLTLSATGNNQQRLFRIVNRLLHRKGQRELPDHTSSAETAKVFSGYFSGKIDTICRELSACRDSDDCEDNKTSHGFTSDLSSFNAPPNGSDQTDHNWCIP